MSDSASAFETIDENQLDDVNGGGFWGSAGKFLGKLAWPVTAGFAAYDGYRGYSRARARGAGVGESIGAGLQNAGSGLTFGLIPESR